jgi:DnaK suppressor protein
MYFWFNSRQGVKNFFGGDMETTLAQEFKEKFLILREELLMQLEVAKKVSEGAESAYQEGPKDDVEATLHGNEQTISFKLIGRSSFLLTKVDESLMKINHGVFGDCEECDMEIGINRLTARPMARLCIQCKEEEERGEFHIPYDVKSHTLGDGLKVPVSNIA